MRAQMIGLSVVAVAAAAGMGDVILDFEDMKPGVLVSSFETGGVTFVADDQAGLMSGYAMPPNQEIAIASALADGTAILRAQFPVAVNFVTIEAWGGDGKWAELQLLDGDSIVIDTAGLTLDGDYFSGQEMSVEGEDAWGVRTRGLEGPRVNVMRFRVADCPIQTAAPYDRLDFFDIAEFLRQYQAGNPAADVTGDGAVNFFDVGTYLELYGRGCD